MTNMKSSAEYVNGKRVFLERNWDSRLQSITILMDNPTAGETV